MLTLSRREMIGTLAGGAAALALGPSFGWAKEEGDPDYAGFKMAMATYTLRRFGLEDALKLTREAGLRYADFNPTAHMKITDDAGALAGYREKLKNAGVTMLSFGVVYFEKKSEDNKKIFEFAKAMGVGMINADAPGMALESLVPLCKEYNVKLALHNHGPGSRYATIKKLQKALEGKPDLVGACVDTGHFIRSGEDNGKVIRALGSRVHSVHVKDVMDDKTGAVLGRGKLDIVDMYRALQEVKFGGPMSLEHEMNEKDPMPDVRECLKALREAAKKLQKEHP